MSGADIAGMVLCCVFIAFFAVFLIFTHKRYIADMFKEKVTFEVAVKAFIEGHPIHRKGSYYRCTTRTTIIDGETKVHHGKRYKDGDFSSSLCFDAEDIFANDWIIEEKK